jgi:hypothetical protein
MHTVKYNGRGLLTGIDTTGTNIGIHCQGQTHIWFQNISYTSNKVTDETEKA